MTQTHRVLTTAALVLAFAAPALAGPPLLCHPFDIGTAASLPWDGTTGWSHGRSDYPIQRLVADTEALLQAATPVVVRMETLRRAALYASQDPAIAAALIDRLSARARAASAGDLAALDAAYAIGALRQVTMLEHTREFGGRVPGLRRVLAGHDAAPFLAQAVRARPADPAVAFGAAMIAMDTDTTAYPALAARARAGAAQASLLARNIDHLL